MKKTTQSEFNKMNKEIDFSAIKILCVEDNVVNQLVIGQYFNTWNVQYSFANTGLEAIEKFGKVSYDLVFMDIRLPDMKGYKVVEKMKTDVPDTSALFIAMTADLDDELRLKIERSGMIDYLNKPFSEAELQALLVKYSTH